MWVLLALLAAVLTLGLLSPSAQAGTPTRAASSTVPAAVPAAVPASATAAARKAAAGGDIRFIFGHRCREYAKNVTNEDTVAALKTVVKVAKQAAKTGHRHRLGCEVDTWLLAGDDGTPNAGRPVIIHDQKLRRTVSPASLAAVGLTPDTLVGNVTYAQWVRLRTKGGQPLPTLQRMIQLAGRYQVPLLVEVNWMFNVQQVQGWITEYKAAPYIRFYKQPHSKEHCLDVGGSMYTNVVQPLLAAGLRIGLKTNPSDCPTTNPLIYNYYGHAFDLVSANMGEITPASASFYHNRGILLGNKRSDSTADFRTLARDGATFAIAVHPALAAKTFRWIK